MGKYSLTIQEIVTDLTGIYEPQEAISRSWEIIFSQGGKPFPIFDERHREPLCRKILEYFYFREIEAETVYRFQCELNWLMHRIMPYYNQLYQSELIRFDPLLTQKSFKAGSTRDAKASDEWQNGKMQEHTDTGTETEKHSQGHSTGTEDTAGTTAATGNTTGFKDGRTGTEGNSRSEKDMSSHETGSKDTKGQDNQTTDGIVHTDTEGSTDTESITDSKQDTSNTASKHEDGTTNVTDSQTKLYSDTPQGKINRFDINNDIYLTDVHQDSGTSKTVTSTDSKEDGELHATGNATTKAVEQTKGSTDTGNFENIERTTQGREDSEKDKTGNETEGNSYSENGAYHEDTEGISESHSQIQGNKSTVGDTTGQENGTSEGFIDHGKTDTKDTAYREGKAGQYDEFTKGYYNTTAQEMVMKLREYFINIDMMIINEVESLFLQVF